MDNLYPPIPDTVVDGLVKQIEALRAENARLLQKAAIPICVGQPIISILAREGAWTSASGASVVASDELFRNDPYAEIARLREALKLFTEIENYPDAVLMERIRAARAAMGESDE